MTPVLVLLTKLAKWERRELEPELELEPDPELEVELELELALGQFTRICFLHPSLDPWPASLALRAQRCTQPS